MNQEYGWLNTCLLAGESVLWRGRPMQGKIFCKHDIFMIPFSIMWGGFAIFWELMVLLTGNLFFALWGIPFVAVGLYMMVGRFFWQEYQKKRTFYAITDQRVLQFQGKRVTFLDRAHLPQIHVTVDRDGSGTIVFDRYGRGQGRYFWGNGIFADACGRSGQMDPVLENIPDVKLVYRILSCQNQGPAAPGVTWNESV